MAISMRALFRRHRLAVATALLSLALGASGPSAWAQAGGGGGGGGGSSSGGAGAGGAGGGSGTGQVPGAAGTQPQVEVTTPLAPTPTPAPVYAGKLFGDWGGLRTLLYNHGVDLELDYVGEAGKNVTGEKIGFDFAGQLGLSLDIDWQKLANVPGFSTHFVIVNREGRNLSSDYLGDDLSQSQEIYGAAFDMAAHLVYFFGEQKLLGDRLNIAVGRMPLGEDFATSPLDCIPISLSPQCGVPRALANSTAFTTWPQNSWAGRIRVRPTPETFIQTGVFDVRPFPNGGRSGFDWSVDHDTGIAIPVEVGWEPSFGPNNLLGHYRAGFVRDTSDYPDLLYNDLGVPLAFSTLPGYTHHGRNGFWVMGDQMLMRNGPGNDQGLIVLLSYAHETTDVTVTNNTAFAMLLDKGFLQSRPNDMVDVAVGWFGISSRLNQLQLIDVNSGLPVANGATGPQTNEFVLEADYSFPVYRGVTLQPGIQYFINPNAETRVRNAVVFAGRVTINF